MNRGGSRRNIALCRLRNLRGTWEFSMATDTNNQVAETETRATDTNAEAAGTETRATDTNAEAVETETRPTNRNTEPYGTTKRPASACAATEMARIINFRLSQWRTPALHQNWQDSAVVAGGCPNQGEGAAVDRQSGPRPGAREFADVKSRPSRTSLHGGLSTGPKTEAGRARIAEAQRRRWRDYRERLEASLPEAPIVKA